MKWTNKGHQFDRFSEIFSNEMKVYIYGAGENGKDLFSRMMFADCVEAFIDNDERKVGDIFCGKKILSLHEFISKKKEKHFVVIAQSLSNIVLSKQQFLCAGYIEGKNLFDYHSFVRFYLPIFAVYSWDKIYIPTVSMLMTTICNLDCKGCLNFTHLNKNKMHYPLEQLKENVDCLFSQINGVGLFHLCGGEPLLYPHFTEIMNYISVKYGNKISELGITTNGTIIPSDELCIQMSNANLSVWVDDYRKNVEIANGTYETILKKMRNFRVKYYANYVDEWINIEKENIDTDEEKNINKCTLCSIPFVSLKNNKVYGCNYSDYACEANIVNGISGDYWELSQISNNKKIFMEYRMGYSDNGYYSYCSKCEGSIAINFNKIPVAEQYSL